MIAKKSGNRNATYFIQRKRLLLSYTTCIAAASFRLRCGFTTISTS